MVNRVRILYHLLQDHQLYRTDFPGSNSQRKMNLSDHFDNSKLKVEKEQERVGRPA